MGEKLKICVVTSDIHYPGVQRFISGILSITESSQYEIVIIADSGLRDSKVYSEYKTSFYKEVFTYNKFVGVIAYTGTMNNYYTQKEIRELLSYIPKNTPIVTASVEIDNYKVIQTDDRAIVKELVNHFINKHQKERFMFIGPKKHIESDKRFNGFKDALSENGIPFIDELVFGGMFTSKTGVDAIKYIIDNKIKFPDAIICANDEIALGVYSEFKRYNIDFSNIAISGFDNKEYTRDMSPSLTTVDQKFYSKGRAAAETIIGDIQGKNREISDFNSIIIYRNSCGCKSNSTIELLLNSNSDISNYVSNSLNELNVDDIESDIGNITEIINNFTESNIYNLSSELTPIINKYINREHDLLIISEILNLLSNKYIEQLNKRKLIEYFKVMEELQLYIHKSISNLKTKETSDLNNKNSEIDYFLIKMASAMNYRDLTSCIDENLYYLGIKSIMLNFPETSNRSLKKLSGRHFNKSDNLNLVTQDYCKVILPITALDDNGYCELETQAKSFHFGEVLSFQISKTLYSIELINHLNDKVKEIDRSYNDLRTTKDLLIKNEKLANLGGLVGGFTHEINTPIGVSVTAISYLEEETTKFNNSFLSGTLKRSEMESYINSSKETIGIVSSNLEKAISLVRGFKQISVDQASDILRTIDLETYLHEVISSLSPITRKGNHSVTLNFKDKVVINSFPGVISQIFTNLIQNSVVHGFENIKNGKIEIIVSLENDWVKINYRDNGIGIDSAHKNKIFEQYFSTKIGRGGSGLGLSIINKLVSSKLNGEIVLNSDYSNGTEFLIKFPIELLK